MKKTVKPNQNNPETKKIQVTKMFNGISSNYDILNKIITLGIDTIWRKRVVSLVKKINTIPFWILQQALVIWC